MQGAGGRGGLTESERVVSQEMNIPGRQARKFKGPEVGESLACAGASRRPVWPPCGRVENALWGNSRGTHQVITRTGPERTRLELDVMKRR